MASSAHRRSVLRAGPEPLRGADDWLLRPVIDRALLESDAEGAEALRQGSVSTWTSLEDFGSRGFWFAAMHGSSVVVHSLTAYVYSDRCEIGVKIQEAHRRNGLGAYTATRTANEAFLRGIEQVEWMSWA